MNPLAQAAAEYLNLGLSVIALTGKMPNGRVHRHGLNEPIVGAVEPGDEELLEAAFGHPDTTGVGILTSFPYVVVDIDGEDGAQQWVELVGEAGFLPPDARWVAKTGRGLHMWFATLQPTGTIKLGNKLDLKGDGGYVAAPPSAHPDGGVYQWLLPPSAEAPPVEVPEQLARRISSHAFDVERATNRVVRKVLRKPRYTEGDTVFYAQRGYEALLECVRSAEEGNRNNMLHWAAATLSEEGGIDEDFAELHAVALKAGLDPVEVKRTIRSARRDRG